MWGRAGFMAVVVGAIGEVRGSQLFHYTAILHHGSSRHTFKREQEANGLIFYTFCTDQYLIN